MPGRGFINYDRRQHKVLSLQDMLVPGQEEAFWKQAELARQGLAAGQQARPGRRFPEDLAVPAHPARGIDLRRGDAEVRRYSIAPYSYAHPELKIPYPRLNGIVKPNLFPGRG